MCGRILAIWSQTVACQYRITINVFFIVFGGCTEHVLLQWRRRFKSWQGLSDETLKWLVTAWIFRIKLTSKKFQLIQKFITEFYSTWAICMIGAVTNLSSWRTQLTQTPAFCKWRMSVNVLMLFNANVGSEWLLLACVSRISDHNLWPTVHSGQYLDKRQNDELRSTSGPVSLVAKMSSRHASRLQFQELSHN